MAKADYTISFLINGTWTNDVVFKRGIYDRNPLDESLDTSVVVDAVDTGFIDIPPFTICRILVTNTETQAVLAKKYFLTGNVEVEAQTAFD